MFELADAFIGLPGGFGTLEEVLEAITWRQLGIHCKPVALLNVCGYFDPLIEMVDRAVADSFISKGDAKLLLVADDPKDLLTRLVEQEPC